MVERSFVFSCPTQKSEIDEQLPDRLRRLINDVNLDGPGLISASLGVASYPLHAEEAGELFQRADEALYVAKKSGRNRVLWRRAQQPASKVRCQEVVVAKVVLAAVQAAVLNRQSC